MNVAPPTGVAEKLYIALCPAATVTEPLPASLHVTSVPTIRLTACECVSVPSVPCTLKLNEPVAAFPAVTVNAAPPAVGTSDDGLTMQVPGAAPVQLSITVEPYPCSDVSVPFHTTFCPTTVAPGEAVTASEKSGPVPVTVNANVCVFAAGAPDTFAASVTVVGPPAGVPLPAVTVSVTVTGLPAVGFTELDGENAQAAPEGNPLGQLSATVPANDPRAET